MYTDKIIKVDMPNYEEVLKDSLVLLDFWAEWCEPCKVQDPILVDIESQLGDELIVGKVNVDDNKYLTQKNGVQNIPSLLLFKDGVEVGRWTGLHAKEVILAGIKKVNK